MNQEFNQQANKHDLIQRLAVATVSATSIITNTLKQVETAQAAADAIQEKLSADIDWLDSLMSRIDSFNETSSLPITVETHEGYMKLDRIKWLSDKDYRRGHQLVKEYQANSGHLIDDLAERDRKTALITSKAHQKDRAIQDSAELAYIQEYGFSSTRTFSDPLAYTAELSVTERLQQKIEVLNAVRTTANAALKTLEHTKGEPSDDLVGLAGSISELAIDMTTALNRDNSDVISHAYMRDRMASLHKLQNSLALYREREEEPIIYIPAPAEMPVVNALRATARPY